MSSQPAAPKIEILENDVSEDGTGPASIAAHEIHVWHQRLDLAGSRLDRFRNSLSMDECERVARFRFEEDRNHYVVARGTLRRLLAAYLNLDPKSLRFDYTEYGRPVLAEAQRIGLDFNLSHSGNVALFAFARIRRIGIDVEQLRRNFSTLEIAERFFATAERDALRELPTEQRHEAFFRCWTRKEAFIKALGEGLSHPLDQFDVSLTPGMPAALLGTRPDAEEVKQWRLWNIQVPAGYVAALAAEVEPTAA